VCVCSSTQSPSTLPPSLRLRLSSVAAGDTTIALVATKVVFIGLGARQKTDLWVMAFGMGPLHGYTASFGKVVSG